MRISTTWMQQRAINEILGRQAQLSDTEQRLASGKRLLNASDDPVAAAQILNLKNIQATHQQYQRNIGSGTDRLSLEENQLNQIVTQLQRARTLALSGTNASHTETDRAAAATELRQIFSSIIQIANTTDPQGDTVFSGNAVRTVPFVQGAGFNVTYHGDDGQRMVSAAPGVQVATGDPGSDVFMNIPAGNGRFMVTANAANTGSAVAGQSSVTNQAAYVPGTYTISFGAGGTWQATDALANVVGTGTYDGHGAIEFGGMQIQMDGTAEAGDSFTVQSGATQSLFSSLGNLIDAFENISPGSASSNVVNRQIEGIDQALQRILDVQARIGSRINTLEQQQSTSEDLTLLNRQSLSALEDLDVASAISQFHLQTTALEAAQQTFVKVQGLSLFNYLR